MTAPSQLLRPILGEVDPEGRLLRADDAFVGLNRRAGGDDGGKLSIPALLSLALLSIRLQMKLSRAVRVADGPEDLELWVEIQPSEKLAKIAITSWRAQPQTQRYLGDIKSEFRNTEGSMIFDNSLRLVRASGEAAQGLVTADFGADGIEVLNNMYETSTALNTLLDAFVVKANVSVTSVRRKFDARYFDIAGEKSASNHDHYQCVFTRSETSPRDADIPNAAPIGPEAMFGKHLAPVLRQPLGRIIANAETISSELQGPIRQNYAGYARDIANAARHLSALVDDLGDLEAIERDDFKTAPDIIELGDVARRVAGLLALKAADHSIRIVTPPETTKVTAIAEFRRTLQILLNLVNNAIRYSPDGTEVKIKIQQEKRFSVISVSDQGKGIQAQDREKIFNKFERLGRSGDGGSGLGLYISRKLARFMGGDLSVDETEGQGSIFTLRLPIS